MGDVEAFTRAKDVLKEAEHEEFRLYATQRAEKASRGEIDWTIQEVCERIRGYAYDLEPDPEVRKWIDELIDRDWERMFYLSTLNVTDPS